VFGIITCKYIKVQLSWFYLVIFRIF
jgi:hypothetical protein